MKDSKRFRLEVGLFRKLRDIAIRIKQFDDRPYYFMQMQQNTRGKKFIEFDIRHSDCKAISSYCRESGYWMCHGEMMDKTGHRCGEALDCKHDKRRVVCCLCIAMVGLFDDNKYKGRVDVIE
jgi:hypothetical protein